MVAMTDRQTAQAVFEHNVCLIGVARAGIGNPFDLTARTLGALGEVNTEPLMISQASAAGSFCFLIPKERVFVVLDSLRSMLSEYAEVANLWARMDVILIKTRAVVDVCERLAAHGVNILAMQGTLLGCTSLIIDAAEANEAARALDLF